MIRPLCLLTLILASISCGGEPTSGPQVELQTELGKIRIELHEKLAPITTANFLRYVDEGRYNPGSFYRVQVGEAQLMGPPIGVVQGGLWAGDSTKMLPPIPFESTEQTGLRHTTGTVSMARFGEEDGARAEFFIVIGEQPHLDYRERVLVGDTAVTMPGYAAFGKVVGGMSTVRAIQRRPAQKELLQTPVPFRAVRVP
ncbi:MAG: peptidylprolyl isomerase [Gemmatimonadota bacterium]|jgi:peptidyl-prolyl cis-trans isomerase A (cyclophilin A)|nr:peptidylprolyl isomerase [Gemmatimonadota bacterium]MDQ3521608.1 peptidylprolyl isomerase [Gemmatimonadota bacterium]